MRVVLGPAQAVLSSPLQHRRGTPRASARRCGAARRGALVVLSAAEEASPTSWIEAQLRRVQGALPVIGLISRIATPEGGFDGQLTYSEYCRLKFEQGVPEFGTAVAELSRLRGQSSRSLLFCCWVAAYSRGILPDESVLVSARRVAGAWADMEYECFRFDEAADAARKRRQRLKNPPPMPTDEQARPALEAALCAWGRFSASDLSAEEKEYLDCILTNYMPS